VIDTLALSATSLIGQFKPVDKGEYLGASHAPPCFPYEHCLLSPTRPFGTTTTQDIPNTILGWEELGLERRLRYLRRCLCGVKDDECIEDNRSSRLHLWCTQALRQPRNTSQALRPQPTALFSFIALSVDPPVHSSPFTNHRYARLAFKVEDAHPIC
jgi:hypothetical protein